jgi:hypothetical protein
MYSKQQLTRLFIDWPSVKVAEHLDLVIARVDIISAIASMEEIDYHSAEVGLDHAWDTIRKMGGFKLVAGGVAFAEQVYPVINKGPKQCFEA